MKGRQQNNDHLTKVDSFPSKICKRLTYIYNVNTVILLYSQFHFPHPATTRLLIDILRHRPHIPLIGVYCYSCNLLAYLVYKLNLS